jgi:hypothetical protein
MHHKILSPCLLALALVSGAPGASAQTAAPAASAVDPATVQALKNMGAHLQSLQKFHVTNELTGERVLTDGQKLQHMASAAMDVQQPNRIRVKMSSARSQRELFYDGKLVTLFTPAQKYYTSVPFAGSIGDLATTLQAKYGVELPLADLFVLGTPAAPLDKLDSAMNAGQDFVGSDLCDHYALRQGNFDWQIWITVGDKPLPRKLVITNRGDEARPQSVSLIEWDLKPALASSAFTFKPPKDAKAIEMVPRKTQ